MLNYSVNKPLLEQRSIVACFDELQANVDAWLPAVLDREFKEEL